MVVGLDDAVGGAALAGDVAIRGTLVSLSFPFLLLGFFFLDFFFLLARKKSSRGSGMLDFLSLMAYGQ